MLEDEIETSFSTAIAHAGAVFKIEDEIQVITSRSRVLVTSADELYLRKPYAWATVYALHLGSYCCGWCVPAITSGLCVCPTPGLVTNVGDAVVEVSTVCRRRAGEAKRVG